MLEMVLMIGQGISAALMLYGAYLAIDETFSGDRSQAAAKGKELPENRHAFGV